jgi:hypothetical protein
MNYAKTLQSPHDPRRPTVSSATIFDEARHEPGHAGHGHSRVHGKARHVFS